jgi:hypothetical protein
MLKDRVTELEAYGTSVERPADFDAFWAVDVYGVHYDSLDHLRIEKQGYAALASLHAASCARTRTSTPVTPVCW